MVGPGLPARKAGGKRSANPTGPRHTQHPSEIELEDGTKIPIKIPQGMPHSQGLALVEYLRTNPDAAKQAYEQAEGMLRRPGMADAFMNMRSNMQDPNLEQKYAVLKDDPDLKCIFDDVMKDGPGALQKYWDDTELMTKVSAKLGGLKLNGSQAKAPSDPVQAIATLHGAAKMGDVDAVNKHLDEGKEVDELNERGITALGVAVGFNKGAVVKVLLERGADLNKRDSQGNTVLHYAAGYGRKEIAEQLLEAGADLVALNNAQQKPVDAARCNREKVMIDYLSGLEAKKA